ESLQGRIQCLHASPFRLGVVVLEPSRHTHVRQERGSATRRSGRRELHGQATRRNSFKRAWTSRPGTSADIKLALISVNAVNGFVASIGGGRRIHFDDANLAPHTRD